MTIALAGNADTKVRSSPTAEIARCTLLKQKRQINIKEKIKKMMMVVKKIKIINIFDINNETDFKLQILCNIFTFFIDSL